MDPVKTHGEESRQVEIDTAEVSSSRLKSSLQSPATPATAESRKPGRNLDIPPIPPPPPHLDDYQSVVGGADLDELRFLAQRLKGKSLKMVNSTAVGGGVAEMLNRLVPLLNELEVSTRWDVITGGNDFFEITKAFHNACMAAAISSPARLVRFF